MSFSLVSKSVTLNTLARAVLQKLFSAHSTELRRELYGYIGCRSGSVLSTELLRLLTRRITLVYRSTYTIFFTTTSQQELCVHQPPTSCSVLHSWVRSMTGRFRLQHLPSETLCRHQPDPLTLLLLLNLDLKPICLRQHILPIGRFSAVAELPIRMRLGAVEIP